jgi:predicted DNA-binding WGR domain protein
MAKSIRNVAVRLENTNPGHNKQYTVAINLRKVKLFWGPIGGWIASKKLTFPTNEEAFDFFSRKIDRELGRGYRIAA